MVGVDWQYSDYSIYNFIEIVRIFIEILIERRYKIFDSIGNFLSRFIISLNLLLREIDKKKRRE